MGTERQYTTKYKQKHTEKNMLTRAENENKKNGAVELLQISA
jgi:hypothetical protein